MISKKKCKRYRRRTIMWHKILCESLFLWTGSFCFVLRDLMSAIKTNWSFLRGINFCNFQKVLHKQIIDNTFVFIEFVQWK